MELQTFMSQWPSLLPKIATTVSKATHVEFDDALQTTLITANEIIPAYVYDIDGNICRRELVEHYSLIDPTDRRFKSFIYTSVRNATRNALRRNRQQVSFEEDTDTLEACMTLQAQVETESSIIVDDFIRRLNTYLCSFDGRKNGGSAHQYQSALRDILAARGFGAYNVRTSTAWLEELTRRPHGSRETIPDTFIFAVNGLTPKQGRTMLKRIEKFAVSNGFKPTKEM